MLDFLGEKEAAQLLMQAIETVTAEGKTLTPDLGGRATTSEVADAVVDAIRRLADGKVAERPEREAVAAR